LKRQKHHKFEKNNDSAKKSSKNRNFNQNKPKNKQPACLQKNCNSTKKQAQICKKPARLATLCSVYNLKCEMKVGESESGNKIFRAISNSSESLCTPEASVITIFVCNCGVCGYKERKRRFDE